MKTINFVMLLFFIISINGNSNRLRKIKDVAAHMHPDVSTEHFTVKNKNELNAEYWQSKAKSFVKRKVKEAKKLNKNIAKNVIMFVGDGMSAHTVTAARIYLGGEEFETSFDKFPYIGLAKTYCINRQVADSACTATAYLSGVKAHYGTTGVNAQINPYKCDERFNSTTFTESIVSWAQKEKKATGFVTTSRVTHATPSGVYAHSADREWESDLNVIQGGCNPSKTIDIARQLVENEPGKNLNVIFGGGRRAFLTNTTIDEDGAKGHRQDGRNLIENWLEDRSKFGNAKYVFNKPQMNAVDVNETDFLLGLFASSHNMFHVDVQNQSLENVKPSLSEMVEVAVKMLQKNKNGFFLFVEGALIDVAHHENWARRAIDETAEFHYAIEKAKEITDNSETLIVVTADHAHSMTINGYPNRGNDILGSSNKRAGDGIEYTTLSYANGEGYFNTYFDNGTRRDISKLDFTDLNLRFMAAVPMSSSIHGGDDVAIYADGPFAHLFTGNYEQNNIPLLMAYTAKLGPYGTANGSSTKCNFTLEASITLIFSVFYIQFVYN